MCLSGARSLSTFPTLRSCSRTGSSPSFTCVQIELIYSCPLYRRGCGTDVDLEARAEMEDTLLRTRSEDSLEELYVRDEKKAARTMRPVSFDVYWHVVYANETKQGGYVSYVPLSNRPTTLTNKDMS
jgi:hypothetical protein